MNSKKITSPPTVVLIGRSNVGKSTLFNRLTESSGAFTSKTAGTTRDRNYGTAIWRGNNITIVDTGGVDIDNLKAGLKALTSKRVLKKIKPLQPDEAIEKGIISQTGKALAAADLLVLVVDGKAGILPSDRDLARVIQKTNKPVLVACNKIDKQSQRNAVAEFASLGLDQAHPVSAANGSGSGDLLDAIADKLPKSITAVSADKAKTITVALIGKPNAGKSSLMNGMANEERVIVSELPHTTRDAQRTTIEYQGYTIELVDTAGIRRQARVQAGIEGSSTKQSLGLLRSADISILVTEGNIKMTKQDRQLAGLLGKGNRGVIIVANKIDLLENLETEARQKLEKYYHAELAFLEWAPLVLLSAKTGLGVKKMLDHIIEVYEAPNKEISPKALERLLKKIIKKHSPSGRGARRPHIYTLRRDENDLLHFYASLGRNQQLHESYRRFVEGQIRDTFGFIGRPIQISTEQYKGSKIAKKLPNKGGVR